MNKKIKYINNKKIITINDQEYISKEYKDNNQIYNYLVKVGFTSFIKPTKYNDKEELIPYVKEYYLSNEIIDIITDLHNKTTKYQKPDKLKQKELYINIKNRIFNTRNYYLKVQNKLETANFFHPSEYLLLLNISNIYKALDYALYKLEEWNNIKNNKEIERTVLLINNYDLIDNKLYNWDNSKRDYPIYDLLNFYKQDYKNLNLDELYKKYNLKYSYTLEENNLFQVLLVIPPIINYSPNSFKNLIEVNNLIKYLEITNNFILKYNKEYK